MAGEMSGAMRDSGDEQGASRGPLDRLLVDLVRHPWSKWVRSRVRDAWCETRGLAIRNPALPVRGRTLLFVCKGNICRSPFAAIVATRRLEETGVRHVSCSSAGFKVSGETCSPPQAVEAARRYGVSLESHRSTALSEELMQAADAIFVMEVAHLALLRRRFPAQRSRVFLLPLFVPEADRCRGYQRYTIADPYGQPQHAFDLCYARVAKALDGMFAVLFGGQRWGRA
jgi:protein-tyrosine-phosphatase